MLRKSGKNISGIDMIESDLIISYFGLKEAFCVTYPTIKQTLTKKKKEFINALDNILKTCNQILTSHQ